MKQASLCVLICTGVSVTGNDAPLTVGMEHTVTCTTPIPSGAMLEWLNSAGVTVLSTTAMQTLDLVFAPVNDSIHSQQYSCRVTTPSDPSFEAVTTITVTVTGA